MVSTLPEGATRGRSRPVDLTVLSNGRFLYVTNRAPNDVAAFAVDGAGTLKLVAHVPGGAGPLGVDPSGRFLIVANEGGKNLGVHAIDPATGALGSPRVVALPAAPLSVVVVQP